MPSKLLLVAGEGASFPSREPHLVTLAASGGTNPWNIPGAYQLAGKVVAGFVTAAGHIQAVEYDEPAGSVAGPYTIEASFQADVHTGPAFARRTSDGRIATVYTKHNSVPISRAVSTNADDTSAWGSFASIGTLAGSRFTDPQLHELSDGTLFLFYRDEPSAGTDSRWAWSTSTDGGLTWAAGTNLFRIASTRSYVITWRDGDTIHFCATNAASSGYTKLGHFTMDGLTLARKKTDGTSIGASLPLTFTDITEAYVGTTGVQPWNVVIDGSGHPHFMVEDIIAGDLSHVRAWWTGSAWTSAVIDTAGTGYEYSGTGSGFSAYGAFLQDSDPDTAWLLREGVGDSSEFWRYRYSAGAWDTGEQMSDTGTFKVSPICVRDDIGLRGYCQDSPTRSDYITYSAWTAGLTAIVAP